jgi:antitoxin (DNA-binding transcriptional repressor) of toxin-antitoxin stability system
MRQVQLHEAQEQFAALVSEAEAGESLTILRGDKPVAQIIPFPAQSTQDERSAARDRLFALMDRGVEMGTWNGRDELYDRD